jgi:hypothetical protein
MRREQTAADLGHDAIRPDHDVVACQPYAWDIVYTCGKRGIAEGGAIRFDIPYGFSPPQTSYSSAIGFTTVETSNAGVRAVLSLHDPTTKTGNQGVWAVHVYAAITAGGLRQGDTVTLHYGRGHDAVLSNVGAFARYFEGEAEFTVLVDPDGSRSAPHGGFWLLDCPQPRVRVIGDQPDHFYLVIPSIIRPDQPLAARITARDRHENTAASFEGDIVVSGPGGAITHHVSGSDRGGLVVPGLTSAGQAIVRLAARDRTGRVCGISNPCRTADDPEEPGLFWGDLHVMTEISAGLGRPADALAYARDVAHLDFCALTDGDDADGYFTDEEWEETREAVKRLYEPERFATLLASEYHERRVGGDKNVYYRSHDARLIRWSDLEGDQPEALWKALEGQEALTVPHHTVSGSGRLHPWDHHHPDFQRLVEIYSIWGNSECQGCLRPNYWRNNWDNSVQAGLAKGYRMGIVASGDSHDGLPGNSSWMRVRQGYRGGLAAVYSHKLTREAIFDALRARHCYGTTGARMILRFDLNHAHMGQEVKDPEDRSRRTLRVNVIGTAPIAEVAVIRNGEVVHTHNGSGEQEAFEWRDETALDRVSLTDYEGNPFLYYYVRVRQADGELAWSSPIWVS